VPVPPYKFNKLFDLSGRVALITGGAAGFGEAIAIGFAEYGCDVAIADLHLDRAQQVADRVTSLGRRSAAIQADVSSKEQIQEMVKTTVEKLGTAPARPCGTDPARDVEHGARY
jgi:NAD(P)-dependent dehydrogenase (short-subunit alcohol dehydrogenase family)